MRGTMHMNGDTKNLINQIKYNRTSPYYRIIYNMIENIQVDQKFTKDNILIFTYNDDILFTMDKIDNVININMNKFQIECGVSQPKSGKLITDIKKLIAIKYHTRNYYHIYPSISYFNNLKRVLHK